MTEQLELRIRPSLLNEIRRAAAAEGVAVDDLVNVAVAEKLAALRTTAYFAERAARADRAKALRILKRSGGAPPVPGGEVDPPLRPGESW